MTASTACRIVYDEELGHNVRSNWELLYCKILRKLGVEYRYEATVFDLGEHGTYRPDIKLRDDLYVEVKGYLDSAAEVKIRAFRKLYPHISLVIVDETHYRQLKSVYFPNGIGRGYSFIHWKGFPEGKRSLGQLRWFDKDVNKVFNQTKATLMDQMGVSNLQDAEVFKILLAHFWGRSFSELLQDYEEKKRKVQ